MIDIIAISPRVYNTWINYSQIAIKDIIKKYPNTKPSEISDEDFRLLEDGTGEIFVKVRDIEIKMRVPASEFSI